MSICLSVYLSICLSVYLSIYLSVFLSNCLSVYHTICLSVYLSIYPSIYLSIYLSMVASVNYLHSTVTYCWNYLSHFNLLKRAGRGVDGSLVFTSCSFHPSAWFKTRETIIIKLIYYNLLCIYHIQIFQRVYLRQVGLKDYSVFLYIPGYRELIDVGFH